MAATAGGGRPTPHESTLTFRRMMIGLGVLCALTLAYLLRGVLVPLFFAFLLAYALDPFVDRLEALKVPRTAGAVIVVVGIFALFVLLLIYAIPMFVDEL